MDILSIQGEEIPDLSAEIDALLEKGKTKKTNILDGASSRVFKGKKPYATTEVSINFNDENNLRNCVRLLRWSDDRLLSMGASILWSWNKTYRFRMKIEFAVDWYDKDFFERRKNAMNDEKHISYFQMFGQSAKDMKIETKINTI